ncbi:MAG: HipA domain-containing protein [Deltaproteobacteria bacterium]|nr:HipA domain-containing protein [Deltaproteobacteria bacterium]
MIEKKLTVFIYLPNETIAVPAGVFSHNADLGIGSFSYGRRYIERRNALPVDPVSLPIGPLPRDVTSNAGIYGAFRDASPDYWGRLVIASDVKAAPEALSEIDFLVAANATRVGNLDFRLSPGAPEPILQPPHFNQLAEVIEAAVKIEAGEEPENHLLQLLRQGSSMGGARPKCTVEWDDALWIAKFPARGDTLNIPRIEYATITLSGLCGISIPEVHLVAVGDKDVFLCRRFDRERQGEGWVRRGFVSSLSLMQWDEGDRLLWDYASIADTMRRYTTVAEIQELYRRMVFNILVRNTDDHPRNHGFVVNSEGMSLSPAYDILPAPARPGVGVNFRLAMSVGEQGREATLENALSQAGRFGHSSGEARPIIEQLLETTRAWREHFDECGVTEREVDLLTPSFTGAITEYCDNSQFKT